MKQGKLIRRAVSAALAGCMMFTLSAPALAESTDALMQLSIGSYRSSSLLSEENSIPDITVNGTKVNETNKDDILDGENAGVLSYNEATKTLKSSGSIKSDLTIDAKGVNIELHGNSGEAAVGGKLTVINAQDVKVTVQSYIAVFGDVEISCDGKVEITSEGSPTVAGDVTVKQASEVAISGEWNSFHIVRGDVTIECPVPVTIQNKGTGGMASSIKYSGGKYVYSDTENGTPVDPSSKPIDVNTNAVYITPVMAKNITLTHATVDVPENKAYAGQTVTVKADAREGYQFVRWEVIEGKVTLSDKNRAEATFTMPDEDVELRARYNKLYTITATKGTASLPQAIQGTEVTITADTIPGRKFDHWEVKNGGVFLADPTSVETTFKMLEDNVTVEAKYKAIQSITVNQGTYTVNGTAAAEAVKGDRIVATAQDAPAGTKFTGWTATGISLTEEQQKSPVVEFVMPKNAVELTAQYKTLHPVTVTNGKADKPTAVAGETVTITAESREGYVFDRWEVNYGNVAVVNKNAEETTFVMPDEPVTAVAKYKKLLGITVNSGKAYVEDAVTDAALKGKPVVVKADEIEGKRFDHWEIVSGKVILNDLNAPETMFTMPETAVEITAVYNDLHAITVNNGTANVKEAVIGDTVKITAESREGYVFDRWEVSYGDVVVDDKNAEETTFTMPDSMVVLTARYKALQSITLENGKAYAGGEEITTAKKGTEVAIKADNLDGKVFDHWEIVSGNVTLKDANKAETSFTMPAESISLKAVYNTIHSIHTTFCTADPASAIVGTEITVTAETREGYEFDGWAVSDGVELYDEDGLTAKFIMPDDDVTIEAKYKQYHTITMVGGKGTAYDADGKEITSAVVGDKITIVANDRDSHEFNRWEIDPDNVILEDPNADETAFIMPDEPVSVEAKYKHLQSITMNHGTAYDEDFSETDIAKAKQTITIKAEDRYADGLVFDHWTVDTDNVTLADEYGEKTTFEMVNGAVELTAHYKARVTVFSVPAKFEEGIGEHSDETWEKVGETATITAEIDEETFPGMEFDYWEVIPTDLDIGNIHSQTISFEVPECEVKLVAHWKASGMNPDEDLDPGFGVEPESSDGGAGAAIAGVAIGGAAVWGGYEIATRIILNDLLPAGAAIPANRGQLALLIWTEKGKPEPAAQPAFADITDAEQAKAAQWCVEQGTMAAKGDRFEPEGWTPKFKVIEVWNKAFPKQ